MGVSDDESQRLASLGNLELKNGNLDEAIQLLKRSLALCQDNSNAEHTLGKAYRAKNQFQEAIMAFQRSLQLDPSNSSTWYFLGCLYEDLEEWQQAADAFQSANQYNSNDTSIVIKRIEAVSEYDKSQAIEISKSALLQFPTCKEIHRNLVKLHRLQENFQEAKEILDSLVELGDEEASTFYEKGLLEEMLGQYEEALQSFQRAKQMDDSPSYDLLVSIVSCYEGLGKVDQVIEELSKMSQVYPQDAKIQCDLGNAYESLQEYEHAIVCHKKAIELDGTSSRSWFNLGICYEGKEEYSNAVKAYQHALDLDPKDPDLHCNLSTAFYHLGDLEKAIQSSKVAIDLCPSDCDNYMNMACYYVKLKDIQNSFHCLEKAIDNGLQDANKILLDDDLQVLNTLDPVKFANMLSKITH